MPAPTLYDEGWKQGSLIRAELEVRTLDLKDEEVRPLDHKFDLWLLATQDCDLAQMPVTKATRQFELRPVFKKTGDDRLDGLRSRSVLVREGLVLRADSPKLTLTARALNTFKNKREDDLSPERRVQIKTWLGLRYDRPAIPDPFVDLAKQLKETFVLALPEWLQECVRDVWVYFESIDSVRLFYVMRDDLEDRRDDLVEWIDNASRSMCDQSNVSILERQAETSRGTSLWIIQNYYGLGSTDLSIGPLTT